MGGEESTHAHQGFRVIQAPVGKYVKDMALAY
jgi:hypothetical protein